MKTNILAAVALFCTGTLPAQEHPLRAAQVPQVVRDAFHRAYPNSVPRGYSSEQENGRTVYEIESREGAMTRDALITADGTITEVEEGVPVAQLPAAVKTALDAQARGGRVTRSERVIHMPAQDTTYEFAVRGHRGELKFTKNGAPVPVQP